jgi:polysaccharide deacetylase family protein (PEP-CTERM system associated)
MSFRITIDVENLSGSTSETSFAEPLKPLLQLFEEKNMKATFFIVGSLSPAWARQIRDLSDKGHEIGLHGHTHNSLSVLGAKRFKEELLLGKETLEGISGVGVCGYRAPYFSLTEEAVWATDVLAESGFKFSSSVLPAWNPQFGFPKAPRKPFLWKSGLVEFPVPTFGIGKLRLPLLGGAYLRLSPHVIFAAAKFIGSRRTYEWSYCHPYDFDTEAPFARVGESNWIFSKLIYARRTAMYRRVRELVGDEQSKSFEDTLDERGFLENLQIFNC